MILCRLPATILPLAPSHPTLFLPLSDSNACQRQCLPVCHTGSTLTTELRGSLSLPGIVERERKRLLSSKGSSDKKRVKTPESLSPEGRDFSFFVYFFLCCLFPFLIFALFFLCVSLSSWRRENPILPGAYDGRKSQ